MILLMEGFMTYVVRMGSGSMIYITKFHTDRFRHSTIVKEGYTYTERHMNAQRKVIS